MNSKKYFLTEFMPAKGVLQALMAHNGMNFPFHSTFLHYLKLIVNVQCFKNEHNLSLKGNRFYLNIHSLS